MSYTTCMSKFGKGINAEDRVMIEQITSENVQDGMKHTEASKKAVFFVLERVMSERGGLVNEIRAAGGDLVDRVFEVPQEAPVLPIAPIVQDIPVEIKKEATPEEIPQEEKPTEKNIEKSIIASAFNTQKDMTGAKDALMKSIEASIVVASDKIAGDKQSKDYYNNIGYVTFDVPGDGRFKVLNTKERLSAFLNKVNKSPGFKRPGKLKVPRAHGNTTVSTINEMLNDGEIENAYQLAKLSGHPLAFGASVKEDVPVVIYTSPESFSYKGFDFIAVKPQKSDTSPNWRVIEKTTGASFRSEGSSKKAAIDAAKKMVDEDSEKAFKARNEFIKKYGDTSQKALEKKFTQQFEKSKPPTTVKSAAAFEPGNKYAGMISKEYDTEERHLPISKKPTRREDILHPFLKALGIPIYYDRIKKGAKYAGDYQPFHQRLRLKKKNDIEVAAHELAHFIDDKLFNGFGARRKEKNTRPWLHGKNARVYARELKGVSYDAKKVYEGFAEFVRHWMTNPEYAKDVAPEFYKYWEDYVEFSTYSKAIKKAQKGMTDWFNQSAIDRAISKIGGRPAQAVNEAMDTLGERFRQATVDDLAGLLKFETSVTGKDYPLALNPYETARLARAAYSIVDGAFRYGPPSRFSKGGWSYTDREGNSSFYIKDGVVKPNKSFKPWGLDSIFDPVNDQLDDYLAYAVGRSARELMGQGRERHFTREEIEAMLDRAPRDSNVFDEVFKDYQAWNKKVVDFAQDMGVINKAGRKMWTRQAYMPFYRVGMKSSKRRKGMEGNVKLIHRLTGGTENLQPIMDNIIQNASMLIVEGIKNQARQEVVQFAKENRGGGAFINKIAKDTKKVEIDKEQVQDAFLESMGLNARQYRSLSKIGQGNIEVDRILGMMDANMEEYLKFYMFGQAPRGDNVIAVMFDGKPTYYDVGDPLLYRSLAAFNRKSTRGNIFKIFNTVKRIGQSSITLTFDFMGANFWRDTAHGAVFSKAGFKPILDSLSGMKSRITHDAAYSAFIANGGGMSSYLVDPKSFENHIRKFYKKKHVDFKWVLHSPQKALLGLELLADAVEMSTRIGEFKRGIKAGQQEREAAYNAREVSVDFAMRGDNEYINIAYDTIIFLKAAVVSWDRIYRGVTLDPNKGRVALLSALIAMVSALLYLINRGNPYYEALPDWDKDTNWHVIIGTENPIHLRFPRIWEIGALASLGERSIEQVLNEMEDKSGSGKELAKNFARIMIDLFKLEYMPQLLAPLYETYALNRSRFTGIPIEQTYLKELEPFARSTPYTSPTLTGLAEKTSNLPPNLQFSPQKAQALIRGYFNTWGMYGLMVTDESLHGKELPAWRTDQWPGVRRFTRSHPLKSTAYEKEFWDFARETSSLWKTMNEMVKRNRPEIAEVKAKQPDTAFYPVIEKVKKGVKEINNIMIQVYRSDSDPSEKRKQLDELQIMKNRLFKDAMSEIDKARGANNGRN